MKTFCLITAICLLVSDIAVAETLQVSSQRISSSASANGRNNAAITHIYQRSRQQHNGDGNRALISKQKAQSNAVAEGENNTAIGSIRQENNQSQ